MYANKGLMLHLEYTQNFGGFPLTLLTEAADLGTLLCPFCVNEK